MMTRTFRFLLYAALGASASASAAPLGCLITPRQEADIGTPVVGVVESVAVDRGDRIRQGQVLVVLQSRVESANVEVASQRARVAAELRAANANLLLADSRYKRSVDLHGRNFISRQALDQAESEFEVARQRVAQAREQLQVLGSEADLAKAQLSQRTLRAPFDGVVVDRMVQPGERVEDRPLLQVAAIDELQVEVVVPAAQFGGIRAGEMATVRPDVPGVGAVQARVSVVDPMVDAASNTFRVRLAVDNREGQVPAGVRCRIEFGGVMPASTHSAWHAPAVDPSTTADGERPENLPMLPRPRTRGLTMDMRLPSLKGAE